MDLDQMLEQSTAELESAEAELQAVQARVDELRTMREGIRLARDRFGQSQTGRHDQAADSATRSRTKSAARRPRRRSTKRQQPQTSQTELCLQILADLGRPVTSNEVRQLLADQGQIFDAAQIRATFSYLLTKDKVVRIAPGTWALPPSETDTSDDPSAYSTVLPLRQTV